MEGDCHPHRIHLCRARGAGPIRIPVLMLRGRLSQIDRGPIGDMLHEGRDLALLGCKPNVCNSTLIRCPLFRTAIKAKAQLHCLCITTFGLDLLAWYRQ
jgi:hypothetical protein